MLRPELAAGHPDQWNTARWMMSTLRDLGIRLVNREMECLRPLHQNRFSSASSSKGPSSRQGAYRFPRAEEGAETQGFMQGFCWQGSARVFRVGLAGCS